MVRFVTVQVNQNFAINLVAEEPVSGVEARVMSCDGGGGALGHPKVYINLVIQLFYRQTRSLNCKERLMYTSELSKLDKWQEIYEM